MMGKTMFAESKILLAIFILNIWGFAYAEEPAIDKEHNFVCDENNLCSAFLEDEPVKAKKFCDPSHFSVVWKKDTETYLFQCRDGTTSEEESKNWVVDMRHNSFFRVGYGRFYDKNALIANPNTKIPDSFQARPLCHVPIVAKLTASDFVLLDKSPSDDEKNPYCYEPTYLTVSAGRPLVQMNEGALPKGGADYQVRTASANEKAGLTLLLRSLH
jgi:hypothetical protein